MAGGCRDAGAQALSVVRVLSLATLFPSAARPHFGLFVARQAEALAQRGDVDLVVVHPVAIAPPPFHRVINRPAELNLPAEARNWGIAVHYPRYPYVPRFGARWNPALIARAVLPLARRLHAERPFDVVDAQFFYPDGPAAARIAGALGLPLSIKARGSDIVMWSTRGAALAQMRAAARQSGGMLAVSEALKRDMTACGMAAEKIAVHYTGLDHALFRLRPRAQARRDVALMVPGDGALLVSVGNLVRHKGQHLVIEALAKLPGARLVLAGTGPEHASLRALAERLGVADRVHMPGSVEPAELATLLGAADVMALASEREGLANAWVEALACGTPLVITDVGGAREVVREASAGRVVAPTAEAIAGGVSELLADPPAPAEVAANAARFSWDNNAAQISEFWHRLAGK